VSAPTNTEHTSAWAEVFAIVRIAARRVQNGTPADRATVEITKEARNGGREK
jgi:hypothetical protein